MVLNLAAFRCRRGQFTGLHALLILSELLAQPLRRLLFGLTLTNLADGVLDALVGGLDEFGSLLTGLVEDLLAGLIDISDPVLIFFDSAL